MAVKTPQTLEPLERIIVAADFKPGSKQSVAAELTSLMTRLGGSGVTIKINSLLRFLGYDAIAMIKEFGFDVFADLKLNDIGNTMRTDAEFLAFDPLYTPAMLTVMCSSGVSGMRAVKEKLPNTCVLGVTVLTTFNDTECHAIYNNNVEDTVLRSAYFARKAELDGVVASPLEVKLLRAHVEFKGMLIATPGIRPASLPVENDDQKRVQTVEDAIAHGSDYLVIGRPITQALDPRAVIKSIGKEIEKGLERRLQ